MAQASRTISPTVPLSDDPVENATYWLEQRKKPILVGTGVVVAVVALIWGYRVFDGKKREDAAQQLYRAQATAANGDPVQGDSALMRVANNYGGTSAGHQAAVLLAQLRYDRGDFDGGIKVLREKGGSGSDEQRASVDELIAAGFEGKTAFDSAAAYYAKAADETRIARKRGDLRASQARVLLAGNKAAEAGRIWKSLGDDETLGFAQEAQVRLGEISGRGVAIDTTK